MNRQEGSTIIVGLLAVVVLAVIGFGGWYVLNSNSTDESTTTTSENGSDGSEETQDPVVTIQMKRNDSLRINAINAMYQKVEEYYNEYGYYPSEEFSTALFKGIDPDALIDIEGNSVIQTTSDAIQAPDNPYSENTKPTTSQYTYAAYGCSDGSNCAKYTLFGWLESESPYIKQSIN